jgi:N4-gp56 family major capsid protein
MNVTTITATINQYGDYVTISDILDLTAIDNNLLEAQELLADQAGRTLDTITREVMVGGTNVLYVDSKTSRATLAAADKLKVADIKNGVRILKNSNAKKINGYFVAIIHPDVEYDITNDSEWIQASEYAGSTQIFEGEIGKLYGVRFVESTEAKVWAQAGANSESVYATMLLGQNFYGTTAVDGGGLQFIVKQKGSAGTGDPLDQRATAGWKAIKTAVRLVEQYGLRIESCSTYSASAN